MLPLLSHTRETRPLAFWQRVKRWLVSTRKHTKTMVMKNYFVNVTFKNEYHVAGNSSRVCHARMQLPNAVCQNDPYRMMSPALFTVIGFGFGFITFIPNQWQHSIRRRTHFLSQSAALVKSLKFIAAKCI